MASRRIGRIFTQPRLFQHVFTKETFTSKISSVSFMHVMTSLDSSSGIAQVKLNRPPVNSLNYEMLNEMSQVIKEMENTKACRGLVITSNVPNIFCAGLDIKELYKPDSERLIAFWTAFQQMWIDLYGSKLATVAAVTGHAPAGGCVTAMSCDYRIMSRGKATIGMNETLVGIAAPLWVQDLLINTVGNRQAERILNLGSVLSPEEALKVGLVDEVAATPEDAVKKANEEITKWLKIPAIARQATKKNLRQPFIDKLIAERQLDFKRFTDFVKREKIQENIGGYLAALANKKRKS